MNEDYSLGYEDGFKAGQEDMEKQEKAFAQPEQEPVAWMSEHRFDELRKGFTVMTTLTKQRAFEDDVAIYTTPPQRKPLTESHKQEPVAWAMLHDNGDFIDAINPEEHARIEGDYKHALYTTPPQRTWVGLTNDEVNDFAAGCHLGNSVQGAIYKAEAKLKEKNAK